MKAIYKKELKSYFTSIIACLYIAITILASGIAFIICNLKTSDTVANNTELEKVITIMSIVFLVAIPILVMRSFSEERNQKTDQLLYTTPISIGKIIFGKFFAILTIYILPFIVMCVYPLVLKHYGDVNLKLAYANIAGLALYGIVLIAVCMFISALTEMQVISATISAVVLAISWCIGYFNLTSYISKEGNILTKIISCFDTYSPLRNICSGLIDLKDIVFYVSIIILFLFLTYEAIQKRRWSVSVKNIGVGVFSTLFTVIIIAIVVFVNIFTSYVTENKVALKWDVTTENYYGITTDTRKMLEKLDDKINIYVMATKDFLEKDDQVKQMKEMYGVDLSVLIKTLDRYDQASSKINVEYIDTEKNPTFAQKYISDGTSPVLIVNNQSNNKSKGLGFEDIFKQAQTANTMQQDQTPAFNYDAEGQIDSAILYVTTESTQKALFVTGHKEVSDEQYQEQLPLTNFKGNFEKRNISIDTVNLAKQNIDTNNCQVLVIFGPQNDFSAKETKKVEQYLNEGGKLIVALENSLTIGENKKNLYSLLGKYNIKVTPGLVIENDGNQMAYGDPTTVMSTELQGFGEGESTVISPYSIGLKKKDAKNEDDSYISIASSSAKAVLKKDPKTLKSEKDLKYKKGDVKGPFDTVLSVDRNVAATESSTVGTDKADSKQANLLVFASILGLSDSVIDQMGGDQNNIVNNALSQYLTTDTPSVSVPAKSMQPKKVIVPSQKATIIAWALVVVIPLAILLAGIIVWVVRRKR